MKFNNPEILWLLLFLPFLIFLFAIVNRRAAKRLKNFARPDLLKKLVKKRNRATGRWKQAAFIAAVACLLIALARPQLGVEPIEVKRTGVDIMIALDTSYSMAAEDIAPNRLAKAKKEVERLAKMFEGNRIGLLVFAGDSSIECPLTFDLSTFRLFLNAVGLNSAPVGGTDISGAIRKGIASLKEQSAKSRVLVIITDGEDTEGDPIVEAEKAAKEGIRVYTVGIGGGRPVPIPIRDDSGNLKGYKKDRRGETVLTKLNGGPLREVARLTGGLFISSTDTVMDIEPVVKAINSLEKSGLSSTRFTLYVERFQIFVAAAGLLLFMEFLL